MIETGIMRRIHNRLPYSILVCLVMVVSLGIINLSSSARATRPDLYFNQLAHFGLGFLLMSICALMHTRVIRRLSYISFIGALILLALVLAIGLTVNGSKRWLLLGPVRLQPSDPAKIALILAVARYCSQNFPHGGYTLTSLIKPLNITRPILFLSGIVLLLLKEPTGLKIFSEEFLRSAFGLVLMILLLLIGILWLLASLAKLFKNHLSLELFIAPIDLAIIPFSLIYLEPDLGTGLIFLAVAGIMFLYVGIRRISLLLGILFILIAATLGYFTVLKDYQKQRLVSFFNQDADLHGHGYHAMQSIIAIGSGRLAGKGYNQGTQTQLSFLPENSTDFVFSVWAEEWGFVASSFLIFLYFLMIYFMLRLGVKVHDKFSQLIIVGVSANFFIHIVINIGMVTGLLPVVGVPLPLMSYGGSVMTTTLIGIGLVLNVAIWRGAK